MGTLKLDNILDTKPDMLVGIDMSCLMHLSGLAQPRAAPSHTCHAIQILRDTLKS